MPRSVAFVLALWLLTATSLSAQTTAQTETLSPGINERFLDPNLDPQQWLARFEVESREVFAHRQDVVQALQLTPGTRIADIGSGTGLFLELFSKAVTDTGKVYALDISPRLIEFVKQRVQKEKLKNVEAKLSQEDSTGLPNASIDVAFVCDTYHHFENHEAMLRSIRAALRPGGQLVVIDFQRIPGKSRDWVLGHVRADKEQVRQEIKQAGFVFQKEVKIPGFLENYFLRFKKP